MGIEIKSYYGEWKSVDRDTAFKYVHGLIDKGCRRSAIDGEHLRGITVNELYTIEDYENFIDHRAIQQTYPLLTHPSPPKNPNERPVSNCVVELEDLARKQAFCRFREQILFSLMVWQNDEVVKNSLPSVIEWLEECATEINSMLPTR